MAVAELKKLGLEQIPLLGLAKEFEEIYLPDRRPHCGWDWTIRR